MRRIGADRLHIDSRDDAGRRDNDVDVRISRALVAVREGVVVPAHGDRGFARGDGSGHGDYRHEVLCLVEFAEELEAGRYVVEASAVRDGGGSDRHDGLVRGSGISGEGDFSLVFAFHEILPVCGRVLHEVLVDLERERSVIIAVPESFGVLDVGGNRVPGRNFVGLDESVCLRLRTERESYVDDVGRLGTLVALVCLDRLEFIAGGSVGIELVDLDSVFFGELGDDLAVVDPVMGKGR